jgi:autotransporter-associated beta strand protein
VAAAIGGSGSLVKTGSGRVDLTVANGYTGGTTVAAGTLGATDADALPSSSDLTVADGATAVLAAPGGTAFQLRKLTLSATATVDLTDGALVLDGTATPLADVASRLASGYNPADPENPWKGCGITSSSAAAQAVRYAVGYALNGDYGELAWSTWFGRTVNNDSILVRYTYAGDADLNGEVTTDDFDLWKQGYIRQMTGWVHGDLDYSGDIKTDDFDLWKQVYVKHYAPMADGSGGAAGLDAAAAAMLSTVMSGSDNAVSAAPAAEGTLPVGSLHDAALAQQWAAAPDAGGWFNELLASNQTTKKGDSLEKVVDLSLAAYGT